ncbi:hypothetical protein [Hoyosella altamirensis]|uniref:Ferredoxin n=1 Tax=Hoyosella altamirensis TaxID=616997 RepID=A0A839RSU2_9ACTN|nr:hypothetical protein [Hoyosella altamirensis]MBB3039226.1 hypothetical protein [Hoyosella altamirensis]
MTTPLSAPMCPVQCARCGSTVRVRKNSLPHTTVQWTAQAVASCYEFAPHLASGTQCALIRHCGALRDSIEAAVARGDLEVDAMEVSDSA